MIDSLLYAKLLQQYKRSVNLAYLENGLRSFSCTTWAELDLSRLETDAESLVSTIATTAATVNKHNQPQNPILQQTRISN